MNLWRKLYTFLGFYTYEDWNMVGIFRVVYWIAPFTKRKIDIARIRIKPKFRR